MTITPNASRNLFKPNMPSEEFINVLNTECYFRSQEYYLHLYTLYTYLLYKCESLGDVNIACNAFENFITNEIDTNTPMPKVEQYVRCITNNLPYEHLLDIDTSIGCKLNVAQIDELIGYMKETLTITNSINNKTWIEQHTTLQRLLKSKDSETTETSLYWINRLRNYETSEENISHINIMLNIIKEKWNTNLIREFRKFTNNIITRNLTSLELTKLYNYIQLNKLDKEDSFLVVRAIFNLFNIVVQSSKNADENCRNIEIVFEIIDNALEIKESILLLKNDNLNSVDRAVKVTNIYNFSLSKENIIEKLKYIQ